MKKLLAACVIGLALAGCTERNLAELDIQREADVACRAIGASLGVLAPHRQELPESVEATVQRIRTESDALCTGPNPPRTTDVVNQLIQSAYTLMRIEGEVQ